MAVDESGRGLVAASDPRGAGLIGDYRVRRDGWTEARQRAFLRALSETGCVRDACARVQISSTSAYRMRRRSAAFERAWERAIARAVPTLEQAAYERAVIGWDEPVYQGGKLVGARRRYSDSLLRLLIQRGDLRAAQRSGTGKSEAELIAIAREAAHAAGGFFSTSATAEETDRSLLRKLDGLAKQMKREEARTERRAIGDGAVED